jgi:hypothetical protein
MKDYSPEFQRFLAWEAISRDHIDVKTIYIDMAEGDHAAGIFLSQLVYWYLIPSKNGRSKLRVHRDGEYWVAKGREEWYEEIRLKPRQFDRVTELLEEVGVIETRVYKFAGVNKKHTRIVVDRFLELWEELASVDLDDLPHTAKSNSPDRELHIQRLPKEKDEELSKEDNSLSATSSSWDELTHVDEDTFCDVCGKMDKYAIKLDKNIDPKERCAWCFIVDGWKHSVKVRVPQRTGTSISKAGRKKAVTRLDDDFFRAKWVFALQKAGRMKHLTSHSWFNITWFLKNDANIVKIIGENGDYTDEGVFESFEETDHPASYSQLKQWLAQRAAGIADSQAVKPAGWAPIG